MKQFLVLGIAIMIGHFAFGQHENDPSYSIHNYKHPNKAAYAKKHKLDNSIVIPSSEGRSKDNYKQSFNKPSKAQKIRVKSRQDADKKKRSYKQS